MHNKSKNGSKPKLRMSTIKRYPNCTLLSYNDPIEEEAGFVKEFEISIEELLQPLSDTFINSFTIPTKPHSCT